MSAAMLWPRRWVPLPFASGGLRVLLARRWPACCVGAPIFPWMWPGGMGRANLLPAQLPISIPIQRLERTHRVRYLRSRDDSIAVSIQCSH